VHSEIARTLKRRRWEKLVRFACPVHLRTTPRLTKTAGQIGAQAPMPRRGRSGRGSDLLSSAANGCGPRECRANSPGLRDPIFLTEIPAHTVSLPLDRNIFAREVSFTLDVHYHAISSTARSRAPLYTAVMVLSSTRRRNWCFYYGLCRWTAPTPRFSAAFDLKGEPQG